MANCWNASSAIGVRANPMIAKRRARQFCAARLYKAGISFLRERSPDAPKITIVHGSAGLIEPFFAGASAMAVPDLSGAMVGSSLFCRRFDRVASELVSHRGEQLVRVGIGITRRQTLQ